MKCPPGKFVFLLLLTALLGSPVLAAEKAFNMAFDRVDVHILAQLVGERTGRRFVVDEAVKGKLSVASPGKVTQKEIYPMFLSVLESNGYTVVPQGDFEAIVPLKNSEVMGGKVYGPNDELPAGGLITRLILLNHISADDLGSVLRPLVQNGDKGGVATFSGTNHIILTDTVNRIRELEKLIAELDQPGTSRKVEVIPLEYADPTDVAQQVTAAIQGSTSSSSRFSQHVNKVVGGSGNLPASAVAIAATQSNSIMLVGTPVQITELRNIVMLLDAESDVDDGPLNAINLKYISAEEAAKSITALLDKSLGKDDTRRISIEPSIANNALLVSAAPRDLEKLKKLVEQLDIMPQQVLIEVLIADMTLGDGFELGVEWSSVDVPEDGSSTFVGRSQPSTASGGLTSQLTNGSFPQGMTLGVAQGLYTDADGNVTPLMPFILHAMQQNSRVKILSNVPLWAQDNKEASVSIVKNIPLLKSTVDKGTGVDSDYIQNIERKDIGIGLTVTPRVNDNGEILMVLNPSIEAIIDEGEAGKYTPTYARREVKTTITVSNETTVAISGLIREDEIDTVSKIPILGDIPLIGALFRWKSKSTERTNLMIFVTPHIVTTETQAAEMRAKLEEKTGLREAAAALSLGNDSTPIAEN